MKGGRVSWRERRREGRGVEGRCQGMNSKHTIPLGNERRDLRGIIWIMQNWQEGRERRERGEAYSSLIPRPSTPPVCKYASDQKLEV